MLGVSQCDFNTNDMNYMSKISQFKTLLACNLCNNFSPVMVNV